MKPQSSLRATALAGPIAALLTLTLATGSALAVDGVWILNGNSTWSTAANWADGADVDLLGDIADGVGAIANFDTVVFSSNRTITLDSARTIGTLQLGNSPSNRSFNLLGANILTLDNGGGNAQITFKDGGSNANLGVAVALNSNLLITNSDDGGDKGFFFSSGLSSINGSLTITNNSNITSRTKFNSTVSDGTAGNSISYNQTIGWTEFNNANTFTGTTTNVAGTMILGTSLALQNSALDTTASGVGNGVANGNGLKIKGTATALTLGGLTGNKAFGSLFNTAIDGNNLGYGAMTALTLNPGTGVTNSYSGAIANGAAGMTLTKTGAGTQILSGTSTYTGGTSVTGGVLDFGNTNAKATSGSHAFAAGTTLGLGVATSGSFFTSTDIDNAFSGTMTGNLSNVTVTSTTNVGIDTTQGDFTYATSVSGSPTKGLVKLGSNKLTLSGTNTYTGATTISAGTLSAGVTANLGDAASNLVFDGGTLQITGTTLANFSGIGHTVSFNAGKTVGLDIDNSAHTFTVDQVLNQTTGGFTKLGAGTADLNLNNTYTGATNVNGGTLNVNGTLGAGANAVNVNAGAKLKFGTVSQTLGSLTIGAGSTVVFTSGTASGAFSDGGGKTPSFGGASVVPEPGTLGLLLVGALGVLHRRRRQA